MESITTALTTMASTIATNVTTVITGILPTLGSIVSIGVVVAYGIKWIRRLSA